MRNVFAVDSNSPGGVSTIRLHVMRVLFAVTFVFLGADAWMALLTHRGPWDPMRGVAFSFWAAYSTLMILGLRDPLKMVPLLLLQFLYKLVWLIAVAYPLWSANQLNGSSAEMATVFLAGVVIDLLVIPWPYTLKHYVLARATE